MTTLNPTSIDLPAGAEAARGGRFVELATPGIGCGLLGLLVFVNEAVLRTSDVERFSFDGQMALRLGICALCGLYGLVLLPQTWRVLERFPVAWGVLFCGWGVATVPFALNPTYSLGAIGALFCILLFAPALLTQAPPRAIVLAIVAALTLFILASWAAYYAWPALGRFEDVGADGELKFRLGGLGHPNGLGRQCALMLALLVVLRQCWQVEWRIVAPLAVIALATLWRTDSRTAMAAGAAAVVLLMAQVYIPAWRLVAIGGLFAGLIVGAIVVLGDDSPVAFEKVASQLSRTGEAEEIYNLTGRTDLWAFAWEKIAASPVFGYGYGGARFVMVDGHFATHHAHNLLLNTMLGSGIVGGAMLLAMIVAQIRRMFTTPAAFPDAMLALVCVGGLADYVMLNPIPDSHTALWLLALCWRPMDVEANA